jgi:hypothetical protein
MEYYVYEYLRKDGTPYYVGKGKGKRWRAKHSVAVPPKERVKFVEEGMLEQDAFKLEEALISKYGRKDLGTGILRNLTSGGEGQTPGPETKAKLSAAKIGKKPNNYGKTVSYKKERKWDRQGDKHHMHGKNHTDEARQKISEGIKANWDRPVQTCPHCGKQGTVGMTRWHFDNCKHKEGN